MDQVKLAKTVKKFNDDQQYRQAALEYGLKALSCLLDGLDADSPHKLGEFSADNHFAHNLWRGHDPDEAL